jgi:hypothetical protein
MPPSPESNAIAEQRVGLLETERPLEEDPLVVVVDEDRGVMLGEALVLRDEAVIAEKAAGNPLRLAARHLEVDRRLGERLVPVAHGDPGGNGEDERADCDE